MHSMRYSNRSQLLVLNNAPVVSPVFHVAARFWAHSCVHVNVPHQQQQQQHGSDARVQQPTALSGQIVVSSSVCTPRLETRRWPLPPRQPCAPPPLGQPAILTGS
jgi:hypothetical protein